jgi:hypothetical protein
MTKSLYRDIACLGLQWLACHEHCWFWCLNTSFFLSQGRAAGGAIRAGPIGAGPIGAGPIGRSERTGSSCEMCCSTAHGIVSMHVLPSEAFFPCCSTAHAHGSSAYICIPSFLHDSPRSACADAGMYPVRRMLVGSWKNALVVCSVWNSTCHMLACLSW